MMGEEPSEGVELDDGDEGAGDNVGEVIELLGDGVTGLGSTKGTADSDGGNADYLVPEAV